MANTSTGIFNGGNVVRHYLQNDLGESPSSSSLLSLPFLTLYLCSSVWGLNADHAIQLNATTQPITAYAGPNPPAGESFCPSFDPFLFRARADFRFSQAPDLIDTSLWPISRPINSPLLMASPRLFPLESSSKSSLPIQTTSRRVFSPFFVSFVKLTSSHLFHLPLSPQLPILPHLHLQLPHPPRRLLLHRRSRSSQRFPRPPHHHRRRLHHSPSVHASLVSYFDCARKWRQREC